MKMVVVLEVNGYYDAILTSRGPFFMVLQFWRNETEIPYFHFSRYQNSESAFVLPLVFTNSEANP